MNTDINGEGLAFEFPEALPRKAPKPAEESPPGPACPPTLRLLALAHRIDARIKAGEFKGYEDAAKWLGVSRARVSQIMTLLLLSPAIQEAILTGLPPRLAKLTDKRVRPIAATADWSRQLAMWAKL
ncbi:MAG: hypothetical protein EDM74_12665 [Armatimonadetes bacterium]|nr:MAG: hypothetical protein EDM74_12665 [Armatimonadota bacterium]